MQPLRIALTKGRLEKSTAIRISIGGHGLLPAAGEGPQAHFAGGGRLPPGGAAKAADVITYVEHGVCDMGVVGKDTIMENGSHFFEILDLGFGRCGFALAAPKGSNFYGGYRAKTIATKYPNVAPTFFREQTDGRAHHPIRISIGPFRRHCGHCGNRRHLAGKTAWRWWSPSTRVSARLIVNAASLKLRKQEIEDLAARLEREIQKGEGK